MWWWVFSSVCLCFHGEGGTICVPVERNDDIRHEAEQTRRVLSFGPRAQCLPSAVHVVLGCELCSEGQELLLLFRYCLIHNSWFSKCEGPPDPTGSVRWIQ